MSIFFDYIKRLDFRCDFRIVLSLALIAGVAISIGPLAVLRIVAHFRFEVIAWALGLAFIGWLAVLCRLAIILKFFRLNLSWRDAFLTSAGYRTFARMIVPFGGIVFNERNRAVREGGFAINPMVYAHESIVTMLVGGAYALLGFGYLIKSRVLTELDGFPFIEVPLVLTFILVVLASVFINRHCSIPRLKESINWKCVFFIFEILILTVVGVGALLLCFALLFNAVAPDLDWPSLLSVVSIVFFSMIVPLSFGGWGVREVVAILLFGLVGIRPDFVVSASVLCGFLATIAAFGFIPFSFLSEKKRYLNPGLSISLDDKVDRGCIYNGERFCIFLSITTTIFVFFQIHIGYAGSVVNFNLADPFAIFSLILLIANSFFNKRLPSWNVPYLNFCLLAMGGSLVYGLALSWFLLGHVSGWAIGKVIGWWVLLGYMAAGALMVIYRVRLGSLYLIQVMAISMALVVIAAIFLTPVHEFGVMGFLHGRQTTGFEAYSGNRNALAFQLLVVISLYLPVTEGFRYVMRSVSLIDRRGDILLLGVLFCGVFLTASRSALIAEFLVLSFAWYFNFVNFRRVIFGLLVGGALWGGLYLFSMFFSMLMSSNGSMSLTGAVSSESSDVGRWQMIKLAIELWLENPIFGNGLGVFLVDSVKTMGFGLVIHNTLLWLFAEIGVVGALPFLAAFLLIISSVFRGRARSRRLRGALLLVLTLSIMSVFHEVLYQRIFWIGLGSMLALRAKKFEV